MTVADNTSRNQYTATSGQTVFAYTFEIVDKGDIVVLQNGTTLSEGTNYTVSGVSAENGGNITLTVGATTGDVMTIYRDMAYSRTQNYADSGDFLASEVNSDFDNLWLAGEQTNRAFSQSIRKPITDSDSISMELPDAATRAEAFLAFDSSGAVTTSPIADGVNPSTIKSEAFTGDGTTTVFTLTTTIGYANSILIYIDGIHQDRGTYSVLGYNITFTEAPPADANIEVLTFKVTDIVATSADAITYTPAGDDAVETTVQDKLREGISVKDFGARGDGTTDDTTAIQNAINYASNNEVQTIYFPEGHYKYTTLRFYHDATDNPNFQETPNRDGRFQLRGSGRLAITDLKNVGGSPNRIYGSILESTSSGDGLIVEPTGDFSGTDARNFVIKDLTLIADNTGYIVTAESCPGLTFDHCSFKQLNGGGSGILARNCWFFTMNQCYVFGASESGEPETNTGDGISSQFVGSEFGSFAGLWNITDSLIDSFSNGVHWTGGTVTNLSLRNTGVQNCNNYNIYADAGTIQQMLLDNVYMENQSTQGVSFIKGDGNGTSSAIIRNLRMTNCFMLAGGSVARVTGPCIDIDSIDVIDIEGMYVFRPRQTFLNITATKNSQNVPGEIKNSIFTTDQDLSAEPTIYLLTGKIPNVHNCVWPGFNSGFYNTTNDILLFDSTVESNFPRQYTDIKGTTGTAKFGFGDTKVETVTSSPYNITGSNSRTYYDLTHSLAGGVKVILPDTNEVNDGRLMIIKNNESSTSSAQYPFINVVNNSAQTTTIAQLSPGQAGLFIMDKQSGNKFKYVGRIFTDDLELTDNHKITFGRGDATSFDMEIYHDSTSSESRIDVLDRLHINDTIRLEPRATEPSSPGAGDIYYDSTTNKLRCYNGTTWNDLF